MDREEENGGEEEDTGLTKAASDAGPSTFFSFNSNLEDRACAADASDAGSSNGSKAEKASSVLTASDREEDLEDESVAVPSEHEADPRVMLREQLRRSESLSRPGPGRSRTESYKTIPPDLHDDDGTEQGKETAPRIYTLDRMND